MVFALPLARVRRGATALVALVGLAALGCGSRAPERPSILLLTIDTLRADHLATYGYFRATAPELERLAGEAIVFERCLAPMAVTLPSHVSLLTGTEPPEHGVLANVRHGGQPFTVRSDLRSFTEFARDAGYRTAAFVSATPLKRGTGIEAGFDVFDQPRQHERRAAATIERAMEWLDRDEPGPFLLWVHVFDPHAPYSPPAGFADAFEADAELASYMQARRFRETWPAGARDAPSTADHLNRYDGEIRYLDGQFGLLRARLEALDAWSDLVVVVAGDHGEGLGQHDEAGHGDVYWEQLHTPLFVRVPGVEPRRVATPVSLTDALPTTLSLLDSEAWTGFLEQASGVDALAESAGRRAIVSWRTGRRRKNLAGPAWAITTLRYRFIREPEGRDLLFDHATDPHELQNLIELQPEVAARFASELERRLEALAGRAPEAGEEDLPAEFDPERMDELRALGYVD